MSAIKHKIKVQVGDYQTGNILPLLHQIRHALSNLLNTGETTTIDLRSLPMAPGEQDQLLGFLGQGEVNAQLEALGKSEIIETSFPGIWLTTHLNSNREIIGRFIEVTPMPAILKTQAGDMKDALASLQAKLEEL